MIWPEDKSIIFQLKDFGAVKAFEFDEFIDGIPLLDLTEFCNVPGTYKNIPSRSDFRRLIKQNGLRINNRVITDPNYIINFRDFDDDSDFIWITRGKKIKHELFLILTESPITGEEPVWCTDGTFF